MNKYYKYIQYLFLNATDQEHNE